MDTTDLICCLQICLQYMGKQLHISNDLPMRVQTLPAHAVNAKPRTGVQNHREMHITCTAHLMYCAKCEALGNVKQSGSFCWCERQLGKNSQQHKRKSRKQFVVKELWKKLSQGCWRPTSEHKSTMSQYCNKKQMLH